jgi:hypothetical protein
MERRQQPRQEEEQREKPEQRERVEPSFQELSAARAAP